MRNIELKVRLTDLPAARSIAQRVATQHLPPQRQSDTYFHCPHGRLKLRQIDDQPAHIIAYHRADAAESRASDYYLVPVADAKALKQALSSALGMRVVVEKHREIYLYHNVRIHLDEVVNLGSFLEFEAVLGPDVDDNRGHEQLNELCQQFGVQPAAVVPQSYGDLLTQMPRPIVQRSGDR